MYKKKIIYIEQYFFREPNWNASEYPFQIVRALNDDGWDLEVICGDKPYRSNEYTFFDKFSYEINLIKSIKLNNQNLSKLINDIYFSLKTFYLLLKIKKYDLLISQTNPPSIIFIIYLISLIRNVDYVIVAMDIYPDVFFKTFKNIKNNLIKNFIYFLFDNVYRKASNVISIGEKMTEVLIKKGVREKNIKKIYNWDPFCNLQINSYRSIKNRPNLLKSEILILYLGNFGTAHDWLSISKAIEKSDLKPSEIKILFISQGRELSNLKKYIKDKNLSDFFVFKSPVNRNSLYEYLGYADLGYVGIKKGFEGIVVPSKFSTYISMGVPVIYIGGDSDISRINNKFKTGFNFKTNEILEIKNFLRKVTSERKILNSYSENAFNFYKKNMSKSISLRKYKDFFKKFKSN